MSLWIDRIENHTVFAALTEFGQILEVSKQSIGESPELLDHWDRANRIGLHVRSVLGGSDPLLVSPTSLDQIATRIQNAKGEIAAYVSDPNIAHWTNAQAHLDECLVCLAAINRLATSSDLDGMREAASAYRRSAGQLLVAIRDEAGQVKGQQEILQAKLVELTTDITNQKQRLDIAISSFQQQFSDAQQGRQNDNARIEEEQKNQFEGSQKSREESFKLAREKVDEDSKLIIEKLVAESNTHLAEQDRAAKGLMNLLEEHKRQAEKVVGIISATGMVHGYQTTANEEHDASKKWQTIAAFTLGLWIVVAIVFFALTYDRELTWTAVTRQLLISTPFVLLAGFAALQSASHQKAERQLRQAELEIASFDPFLATLTDEERNKAKLEFAAKHFGQHTNDVPVGQNEKVLDLIVNMTKTLHDMQQALKK